MKYPSRAEYATSIRNPSIAFRKVDAITKAQTDLDASLVRGNAVQKVKPNGMKDVWSASGGYAIAFKYETVQPQKTWAVRCFFRANYNIKQHYTNALSRLSNSPCSDYFVDFSYLHEGIRVQGKCHPILKMEWVEGQNLKAYLKAHLQSPSRLKQLAEAWRSLSQDLYQSGIAHGDLQHGNVLVIEGAGRPSLKLIDYDSLYFHADETQVLDGIKGLPGYQPPSRKALKHRCLEIDFFPQLVIYISILALAESPSLWDTLQLDNTDNLLFSSDDFLKPDHASVFTSMATLSQPISQLANQLQQLCKCDDLREIPTLEEAISGQRRPRYQPTYQTSQKTSQAVTDQTSSLQPETNSINSNKSLTAKSPLSENFTQDSSPDQYRQWAEEYYFKKSKDASFN